MKYTIWILSMKGSDDGWRIIALVELFSEEFFGKDRMVHSSGGCEGPRRRGHTMAGFM